MCSDFSFAFSFSFPFKLPFPFPFLFLSHSLFVFLSLSLSLSLSPFLFLFLFLFFLAVAQARRLEAEAGGRDFVFLTVTNAGATKLNTARVNSQFRDQRAESSHDVPADPSHCEKRPAFCQGLKVRLTKNLDKDQCFVNGTVGDDRSDAEQMYFRIQSLILGSSSSFQLCTAALAELIGSQLAKILQVESSLCPAFCVKTTDSRDGTSKSGVDTDSRDDEPDSDDNQEVHRDAHARPQTA